VSYEELEARLAAWASAQSDIRAVVVTGSRARGDADAWSDLDAVILATASGREHLLSDAGWLGSFGEVWAAYLEASGGRDPTWFVVYAGGLKLDAMLLAVRDEDAALELETLLALYPYDDAFGRNVRVLYDAKDAPRLIPAKPRPAAAPPSAAAFEQTVSGFLMAAVATAKFIARGDYWRAQSWIAADLRPHLLAMARLHAIVSGEGHGDLWYGGRFMEQWADERFLAALPQMFPRLERDSLQASLRSMLDVMRTLGTETAARFGLRYPAETHDQIAAIIDTTLKDIP
jgi:aminoglycoside 6-adenylyltransferase